ncbi:MAG: trypsin-like peptidase domain-containing protein [Clostridia bacterium]|nr:trypsin-like peptidase domain-containing protein [Clostridia bacterium]
MNNCYDYTNYTNDEQARALEDGTVSAEPAPKPKKRRFFKKMMSLLLCGAMLGGGASAAFYGVGKLMESEPAIAEQTQVQQVSYVSSNTQSAVLDVASIADGAMASMVAITNVSVAEVQTYFGYYFGGGTQKQEQKSSGSGIIINMNDTELLIVTNNHVVEDAETLSVCFVDEQVVEAVTKGTDPDNDLAVVAVKLADIPSSTLSAIKLAKLGDSDSLKVGEQVVAIGNALGYGQSVTTGIVSALGRQIDTTDAIMIQTDAAINPGNSGGALFNMAGEVIGINSAKYSDTSVEGMGYAISITPALPIINELMSRTTREKVDSSQASYIGVSGTDISAEIEAYYGIPQGVYVTSVSSGSPAAEAGITEKSVITHFDGVRVSTISALAERLEYYAAGETVELTLQVISGSAYVEKTVTITLGSAAFKQTSSSRGYQTV